MRGQSEIFGGGEAVIDGALHSAVALGAARHVAHGVRVSDQAQDNDKAKARGEPIADGHFAKLLHEEFFLYVAIKQRAQRPSFRVPQKQESVCEADCC